MKSLLAVILSLCATCLIAGQGTWPALYNVHGVAQNDVLNVRQAPSAAAPIVGVLASGATNIEMIRKHDTKSWALVNAGEQSGWVSLSFLIRQSTAANDAVPKITSCFGTEPFWALSTGSPRWTWSTPQGRIPVSSEVGPQSANRIDRVGLSGKRTDGKAGHFAGVIRAEHCSDGMSDRAFGIGIDLIWTQGKADTSVYSGCCSIAP